MSLKSSVKIWVPGNISIFSFYEKFYKMPDFNDFHNILNRINFKHSRIWDMVCEIEDFGFCTLAPSESIFEVFTGYFPRERKVNFFKVFLV